MTNIIDNYKNRIAFDIVSKIYCDKIYYSYQITYFESYKFD